MSTSNHAREVADGRRFEFGRNWQRFLAALDDTKIDEATRSLAALLGTRDLAGATFLDVGCGSGLSSLAARRLGATVHAFDYDPQSVACARELQHRTRAADRDWTIEEGSVLDVDYLHSIGKFDVVYSWGVLHHTGAMWQALDNVTIPLAPGGRLFIAIYNYQRFWTPIHTWLKRAYVATPRALRPLIAAPRIAFYLARGLVKDLALLRDPTARYRHYSRARGMSWWHDCLDLMGGYPFETATPEAIFDFYRVRGFTLERLTTCGGGPGCNQFVFRHTSGA